MTRHVSHSSITDLRTCPRRYYLARVAKIPGRLPSAAMHMGSAFHHGLAMRSPQAAHDYYDELEGSTQYETLVEQWHNDAAVASYFVERYMQVYPPWLLSEVPVREALPLAGAVDDFGYIDRVYLDPDTGEGWLVDDKFKAQWRPGSELMLDFDEQVSGYLASAALLAGTQVIDEHCGSDFTVTFPEVVGLKYRVTLKPALRRKRKRKPAGSPETLIMPYDEPLDEYMARVSDDVTARPEHYFREFPLVRSEAQMEEVRAGRAVTAMQIELYEKLGVWPRNVNACELYDGCVYRGRTCAAPLPELLSGKFVEGREAVGVGGS